MRSAMLPFFWLVAATALSGFGSSFSATDWIPGRVGNWNHPANWSSPNAPRTGDDVRLGGTGSVIELRGSTNQLGSLRIERGVEFRISSGSLTTRRNGPVRVFGGNWILSGGQAVVGGTVLLDGTGDESVLGVRASGHLMVQGDFEMNGDGALLSLEGYRKRATIERLTVRKGQPTVHYLLDDPESFPPLTLSNGIHLEPGARIRLSIDVEDFAPRYGQYWVLLQSARILDFTFADADGNPLPHGTVLRIRGVPFSILYGRGLVVLKVLEERNGTLHGFPSAWPDGVIR